MYSSMAKRISRAEVTLEQRKNQARSLKLAIVELRESDLRHQLVS